MGGTNYCSICGGEINGEPLRHSAVLVEVEECYPGKMWRCSDCGEEFVFDDDFYDAETPEDLGMSYCPRCGAKMVGFRPLVEDDE